MQDFIPECKPLTSLEAWLNWTPNSSADDPYVIASSQFSNFHPILDASGHRLDSSQGRSAIPALQHAVDSDTLLSDAHKTDDREFVRRGTVDRCDVETSTPFAEPTQPGPGHGRQKEPQRQAEYQGMSDTELSHSPPREGRAGRPSCPSRQRLLVCHDMMGGYKEDQFPQGGSNAHAYSLWHWGLIDVLVYFSHSLVTIPPPSWTNAAHLHGVQVLGTLITEWEEGASICRQLLASADVAEAYARQLASMAHFYGFDGWLVNIENSIEKEQVPMLLHFVRFLREAMHALAPDSLVIWYDSVTEDGELAWQNRLNARNRAFFLAADGLFTNYSWPIDSGAPGECATSAGGRRADVYMGIDVVLDPNRAGWGFDSGRPLRAAWAAGVSAALFAPAWVYENKQLAPFEGAQERLWASVRAALPGVRPYPTRLPLFSSFNQGAGAGWWVEGRQVSAAGWNNMSWQSLQPIREDEATTHGSHLHAHVRVGQAFNGGAALRCAGRLRPGERRQVALYRPRIAVVDEELHASYSVLLLSRCHLSLLIQLQSPSGATRSIMLACGSKRQVSGCSEDSSSDASPGSSRAVTHLAGEVQIHEPIRCRHVASLGMQSDSGKLASCCHVAAPGPPSFGVKPGARQHANKDKDGVARESSVGQACEACKACRGSATWQVREYCISVKGWTVTAVSAMLSRALAAATCPSLDALETRLCSSATPGGSASSSVVRGFGGQASTGAGAGGGAGAGAGARERAGATAVAGAGGGAEVAAAAAAAAGAGVGAGAEESEERAGGGAGAEAGGGATEGKQEQLPGTGNDCMCEVPPEKLVLAGHESATRVRAPGGNGPEAASGDTPAANKEQQQQQQEQEKAQQEDDGEEEEEEDFPEEGEACEALLGGVRIASTRCDECAESARVGSLALTDPLVAREDDGTRVLSVTLYWSISPISGGGAGGGGAGVRAWSGAEREPAAAPVPVPGGEGRFGVPPVGLAGGGSHGITLCRGCGVLYWEVYAWQEGAPSLGSARRPRSNKVETKVAKGGNDDDVSSARSWSIGPEGGGDARWLGVAMVDRYRVCKMRVDKAWGGVAFGVQAVLKCGARGRLRQMAISDTFWFSV